MPRNIEEISDTPRTGRNNYSHKFNSFNSTDSGYLSFNTQSSNYGLSNRSKSLLLSSRKLPSLRIEPYPSKFNRKFSISESNVCSSDSQDHLENIQSNSSINFANTQVTFNNLKIKNSNGSYRMELRSHSKKQFESLTSFVAVTSCKRSLHDVLPLSPLPTLPSPPFVYEPRNNDTEIKLVIPQSTPCFVSSPKLPTPLHNIAFSPISYKPSPFINTVNSKKFSNLSISEYTFINTKSRPKRLDFSKRAIFESFQKHRSTDDYTGKETIDIFKLLGEKSNHPRIVSKILSYLSPQDLCSISMVSKSWQKICSNDSKAQERRLKYIIIRQCSKENLVSLNKYKFQEDVQISPRTRFPKRGFLTAVPTNMLQAPKIHLTPSSPPVSPSKVIFHSFIKAGRSLAPRDQLVPCPQCKFACRVENKKNVGICSRQSCPMEEFCVFCSSKLHVGEPCKMPLLATPTKRGKQQQPIVGTRQCKRNLRRISRLI
ncbi:PREDICTED: uncharacterized protein LOC105368161 [Ceratosolen solmsi marchali]|uniref:Uncharacterized protein LOC105368161 n=1 Tax=Ceratosolen solmsi marchali TaxID=326594 RepID=A0AAJ7E2G4_9HYME|nr:PREDICTED: uncharacterized protein LOC105368161 [Ceratosolen solmsi marchali]